jgi:hypothetical protein
MVYGLDTFQLNGLLIAHAGMLTATLELKHLGACLKRLKPRHREFLSSPQRTKDCLTAVYRHHAQSIRIYNHLDQLAIAYIVTRRHLCLFTYISSLLVL